MTDEVEPPDRRTRAVTLAAIVVLWLGGLAAGFYDILAIASRYGCSASNHGLGCGNGGTAVGAVIVVVVIATVTAATVLSFGRATARAWLLTLAALIVLAACVISSRALLQTI